MKITLIGATGQLGRRLTARLLAAGHDVIGVGRSPQKVAELKIASRIADCYDQPALRAALSDAQAVVSCAFAGTAAHVLDALPAGIERVVLTGSARRYTRFPDYIANQLMLAETRLAERSVPGVIVHPTMVCGEDGKKNVQRIAAFIRRFGIVPLPDAGRMLLRPVYTGDLAACLEGALLRPEALGAPIVAAGRDTVDYATLVKVTAAAIGKPVKIVSVPVPLLMAAAPFTHLLPGVPTIAIAEVRRLLEDKTFPIDDMRRRLGVEPIGLEEMVTRSFNGGRIPDRH
jgi:uncharacterized protein YbjT (DUF2867 family)